MTTSPVGVNQQPDVLEVHGARTVHVVHLVEHLQFAVAVCDTCGWRSFARRSRPLARDEGRDHERLHNLRPGQVPEQTIVID